jgi:hypothetical protein
MNPANFIPSKITTAHRSKFAYVYLRQSTLGQVLQNTESTVRQYALVECAVALGWPMTGCWSSMKTWGAAAHPPTRAPAFNS